MIKLTKKQTEIVETVKELEFEHNCTLYLMYDHMSGKIRPTKIKNIDNGKVDLHWFPTVCTHNVAMTMENKGILIPEEIATLTDGRPFVLLKLAV